MCIIHLLSKRLLHTMLRRQVQRSINPIGRAVQ
eukprot:COSAG03_NODE_23087_length_283_cov_1.108696_1_plen_32_part_10